ncbi:unnamed protein product [Knipowitschia caucasica]|uniref:Tumor necrosis factor receptor superfamily member 13C n=1 Tax=Knipowitschia caucasica TaxID=637954 RepID=A0AAV2KL24_KNICA
MSKRICEAGLRWDSLLKECMPLDMRQRRPTTTEPLITALVPQIHTAAVEQTAGVQPALWLLVLLAALGSILTLLLWLFLYRRHSRRLTGEEPAEPEPLKRDPPATNYNLAPCGPCHTGPHTGLHTGCHTGCHTAPVWRSGGGGHSLMEHEDRDWCGLTGSAVTQETVPLPTTKLVTTKTL